MISFTVFTVVMNRLLTLASGNWPQWETSQCFKQSINSDLIGGRKKYCRRGMNQSVFFCTVASRRSRSALLLAQFLTSAKSAQKRGGSPKVPREPKITHNYLSRYFRLTSNVSPDKHNYLSRY